MGNEQNKDGVVKEEDEKEMFKDQIKSKFNLFNDISSTGMPSMRHWELSNWLKENTDLIHEVFNHAMSNEYSQII